MNYLLQTGRCFYGIGIAGIGIQQLMYSAFRPMLLPYWPSGIPGMKIWAWAIGIALILAGLMICVVKNARKLSIIPGVFFFALFCFHVYYQVFISPNTLMLGAWTNPLKALAFAGSAFILAASYGSKDNQFLLIAGRIFFSIMLIVFGIDHFLYTDFVATLVPRWIPGDRFWTYFGAVTLIGAGLCILLKVKIRLVALLLALMLFLWLIVLHIPRAVANPDGGGTGNEVTSVFQALAFSGVALVIAEIYKRKAGR